MKKSLIYIIDDNNDICDLARSELEYYGYEIRTFNNGTQAIQAIKFKRPTICIIDLGLPDMDGLVLVKELCSNPDIGTLILSGRKSLPDRVLGLELGADDYITKPFEPRDLVARVHSLMRRLSNTERAPVTTRIKKAQFADWLYSPATLTLTHNSGETFTLSSSEGDLLNTLLRSQKRIISRDHLLGEQTIPYDRSIDSRMSRLRKKIETNPREPKLIKTVYGSGYIFAADVTWIEES